MCHYVSSVMSYHILLLVAVSVESEGAHALRLLLRIHLVDGDEELVRDGLAHQAPHVVGLEIELQFKRRSHIALAKGHNSKKYFSRFGPF